LLVEFMLIERKNRHFRNFNLFKKRVLWNIHDYLKTHKEMIIF